MKSLGTTKPKTKQKILFVFLLIFGNAVMALLTLEGEASPRASSSRPALRPDYVEVRVSGRLKSKLDPLRPVAVRGDKSGRTARHAFVVKAVSSEGGAENFLGQRTKREYLISAPKDQAAKLLGDETFAIYPEGLELPGNRNKSYEVVY